MSQTDRIIRRWRRRYCAQCGAMYLLGTQRCRICGTLRPPKYADKETTA